MNDPVGRDRSVDGLRALAATSVLVFHVWLFSLARPAFGHREAWWDHVLAELRLGLYLFFVITGFLLVRPWLRERGQAATPAPSVRRYALRRAARIGPAYYLAIAIGGLVMWSAAGTPGVRLPPREDLWLFAVFAQNYSSSTVLTLIPPTWTLVVEVAFYACLPFIGWFLLRVRGPRGVAIAGLALVLAGLAWNRYVASGQSNVMLRLALPAMLPYFACGMLAAGAVRWCRCSRLAWTAVGVAGLLLVALDAGLHEAAADWPGWDTLRDFPATVGFAMTIAAVSAARFGSRLLGAGFVVYLGTVSYGLYLWHVPVIVGLRSQGLLPGNFLAAVVVSFAVSLALAALSWQLVEQRAIAAAKGTRR